MFHSARWKAYLRDLQSKDNTAVDDGSNPDSVIYHIFHSETLWFTREKASNHSEQAGEHLKRCDAVLKDCTTMNDALEETLANTPKPSEVLDWGALW